MQPLSLRSLTHSVPTTSPRFDLFLVAIALSTAIAHQDLMGQASQSGSIVGLVTDSAGRALADASIYAPNGRFGAVTDAGGRYQITAVAPGRYTLIFRYIGFRPDTVQVSVEPGQQATGSVILQQKPIALADIVVRAKVEGQAAALNEQKTADNIVNVATADVIKSRPDPNIADAVGRLPGVALERDEGEGKYVQIRGTEPRLSNVTINGAQVPSPEGNVRVVKLDVVPSDLVSRIEVSKTLTADMEADAIGGTVNLVTKAPERDRTVATVTAAGGYIHLENNAVYQGAATYGRRFGVDQRLGLLLDGSFDRNDRSINDVEPVWDTGNLNGQTVPVLAEADLRDYQYYRTRYGFAGDLDYQLSDHSTVYLKTLFSDFRNYGTRYRTDAALADGTITPTSATTGTATAGTMSRSVQSRRPHEQVYSLVAGGNHVLGRMGLDYSTSYSHGQQHSDGYRTTAFALSGVDYTYDVSRPNFPMFTAMGTAATDPTQFGFDNFSLQNSLQSDRNLAAAANLSVPYTLGSRSATIKFGGRLRDEASRVDDHENVYTGFNGSYTLAQALGGFSDPNFYFKEYPLGPVAGADQVSQFEATNLSSFQLDSASTLQNSQEQNFNGSERVYAGYAMNTVDLDRFRLIAGVRVERTRASYTGNQVVVPTSGPTVITPVSGAHSYTDVFPSVQLRYALDEATNLRASYTQGIARPNFVDLAPKMIVTDVRQTLQLGNPNLSPTRAHNLDFLAEHYIGSIGIISGGVFYKKLDKFIFSRDSTIVGGQYDGFTATQPQNGQGGHLAGFEIDWQQRFTFLPGALRGLGVNLNYTYTDSRATVPTPTGTRDATLPRQGKHNANAELTYDLDRISLRGGLTYNSKNIFEYGDDAASDVYLDNHLQFDANASLQITSIARIFVQMLNINNAVFGFYQGSPATPIQREFYGWTTYVGVKLGS